MTRDDAIKKLVPLMENIFDEDDLSYSDDLTADQIDEWDSLSHIRFMVAVEREFSVRFSTGEFEKFANVGELVNAIVSKIGS
jgi:acyl carrier protein